MKTFPSKNKNKGKGLKRQDKTPAPRSADREIKDLENRLVVDFGDVTPADPYASVRKNEGPLKRFDDFPISSRTLRALKEQNFSRMTLIQQLAMPLALKGLDVMAEAETGSGKSLAFLIPVIENLFRARWDRTAGLGAIVITPTRELASQIFAVFRAISKHHDWNSACMIGGHDSAREAKIAHVLNVVIGTPGRILEHLDETPYFDTSNLKILVVDEADLLVDMGFSETTKNIMNHLPTHRQSLLFSATLSFAVRQLGVLTLNNPLILSTAHLKVGSSNGEEGSGALVPKQLKQSYVEIDLDKQLSFLFSFLRSHSQQRTIVFVNSCKQVRLIYEAFRILKPGPALFELHGKQGQSKRLQVFDHFSQKPRACALITTDIAARGLDFPSVDWVIQLNCPPNVEGYIHRIGRTARFFKAGKALLFLLPSEKNFLKRLSERKIQLKALEVNPNRVTSITPKMASLLASKPDIRHLAERAYASYIRSVCLASDKKVFDLSAMLKLGEGSQTALNFAQSLGLATAPDLNVILKIGGDVPTQLEISKQQKKSKLEILKEKIRMKKEQRGREVDGDEAAPAPVAQGQRARRLRQVQEIRKRARPVDFGEDVLQAEAERGAGVEGSGVMESIMQDFEKKREALIAKRIKRGQIRLRADGTAKLRGLAAIDRMKTHVFFEDDKPLNAFEQVVQEISAKEEKEGSGVQDPVRGLKQRLALSRKEDKARDAERVKAKHLKKKRRRKQEVESDDEGSGVNKRLRKQADLEEAALSIAENLIS